MWLGTPGQLVRVFDGGASGQVRVAGTGTLLTVCLDLVPGVREGDWVLVHMGFAIGRMEPEMGDAALAGEGSSRG